MVMCEREAGRRGREGREKETKRARRSDRERERERERERPANARAHTHNACEQNLKTRWLGDEPSMLWVLAIPIQSIQLLVPLHFLAKSRALKIGSEEWRDAHSLWQWVLCVGLF